MLPSLLIEAMVGGWLWIRSGGNGYSVTLLPSSVTAETIDSQLVGVLLMRTPAVSLKPRPVQFIYNSSVLRRGCWEQCALCSEARNVPSYCSSENATCSTNAHQWLVLVPEAEFCLQVPRNEILSFAPLFLLLERRLDQLWGPPSLVFSVYIG